MTIINTTSVASPVFNACSISGTVDSTDGGVFGQDETDIAIISYLLQATDDGYHVVSVRSDDTNITRRFTEAGS